MTSKGDVYTRYAVRRDAKQVKTQMVLVTAPRHFPECSKASYFFVQHFFAFRDRVQPTTHFQNTRLVLKNATSQLALCCDGLMLWHHYTTCGKVRTSLIVLHGARGIRSCLKIWRFATSNQILNKKMWARVSLALRDIKSNFQT